MMPVLGNTAGLWALLAVPAILAIHFLQQRARVARTSTWFLIEKLAPDSARGRTWDRLRSSRALWLQLAAALLATWVLAEPRWVRAESAQTVVVVLDASVSMQPFRNRAIAAADREFAEADGLAARTTWVVMTTDPRQPPLYRGRSRHEANSALQNWEPQLGQHDLGPALRIARGLAGAAGRTLLVTNSKPKAPPDQRSVGVGSVIENVGFVGAEVGMTEHGRVWRALVKNHSGTPQHRTWYVEQGTARSADQAIDLAPDALTEISAHWADGAAQLVVVLSPDAFASDDRVPLVLPQPKPLAISVEGTDAAADFFRKVAAAVEGVTVLTASDAATLRLARLDSISVTSESRGGIFWAPADRRANIPLMTDPLVPERNPLVAGLNWQAWIGTGPDGYPPAPADVPLVWQDRWPLLFLRPAQVATGKEPARGRKLLLAFDWDTSNAGRLPAMVLLVQRFLTAERDAQPAPYAANFDCLSPVAIAESIPAGPLAVTFNPLGGEPAQTRVVSAAERSELRAPGGIGFFEVRRERELVVRGAAQFADQREADFRLASAFAQDVPTERRAAIEHNTRTDPYAPLWLAVVAALVLGSWWPVGSKRSAGAAAPAEVRS